MRSSVSLHSSESQHLLRDLWFFDWLGTVVWVFLAIANGYTGFADVAVKTVNTFKILIRGCNLFPPKKNR